MRVYIHKFQTKFFNGEDFKEYVVVGDMNRKVARERVNLFVKENRIRIVDTDRTTFEDYRWIYGEF